MEIMSVMQMVRNFLEDYLNITLSSLPMINEYKEQLKEPASYSEKILQSIIENADHRNLRPYVFKDNEFYKIRLKSAIHAIKTIDPTIPKTLIASQIVKELKGKIYYVKSQAANFGHDNFNNKIGIHHSSWFNKPSTDAYLFSDIEKEEE
jgi:hypothetical protein